APCQSKLIACQSEPGEESHRFVCRWHSERSEESCRFVNEYILLGFAPQNDEKGYRYYDSITFMDRM
ncbi:MAG TPA: hypothetical protein PLZ38_10330, partial [Spirochaetota bacterium]|nr:hypothetical protein [Spirochaetota bacterium]